MKFVVLFDPTKTKPEERIITFRHDEPGPLPQIVKSPGTKPKEPPSKPS
jgi:hypothetical protein